MRGNREVMLALLNQGADFDAQDSDGNTPAHFCSEYGHASCLENLLRFDPNLNLDNRNGQKSPQLALNKEILQVSLTFHLYFWWLKLKIRF